MESLHCKYYTPSVLHQCRHGKLPALGYERCERLFRYPLSRVSHAPASSARDTRHPSQCLPNPTTPTRTALAPTGRRQHTTPTPRGWPTSTFPPPSNLIHPPLNHSHPSPSPTHLSPRAQPHRCHPHFRYHRLTTAPRRWATTTRGNPLRSVRCFPTSPTLGFTTECAAPGPSAARELSANYIAPRSHRHTTPLTLAWAPVQTTPQEGDSRPNTPSLGSHERTAAR